MCSGFWLPLTAYPFITLWATLTIKMFVIIFASPCIPFAIWLWNPTVKMWSLPPLTFILGWSCDLFWLIQGWSGGESRGHLTSGRLVCICSHSEPCPAADTLAKGTLLVEQVQPSQVRPCRAVHPGSWLQAPEGTLLKQKSFPAEPNPNANPRLSVQQAAVMWNHICYVARTYWYTVLLNANLLITRLPMAVPGLLYSTAYEILSVPFPTLFQFLLIPSQICTWLCPDL